MVKINMVIASNNLVLSKTRKQWSDFFVPRIKLFVCLIYGHPYSYAYRQEKQN